MATQPLPRLTEEQYLRIERAAEHKSEFVGGEIFAMPGGTPKHSMLEINTAIDLGTQLRDKHCFVLSSNMRIRTLETGDEFYPDVSVVCGPIELHPGTNDVMVNPVLLVEVLSPSSANYDRGLKFELYRQIPSLRDYLLIHQDSIFVEHYSKRLDGSWQMEEYRGEDARIPLPAIECDLHLGSIYHRVMKQPA